MGFNIPLITFVAYSICVLSSAEQENGETRMDDSFSYFDFQKIQEAFDKCRPPWFFGYTSTDSTNLENSPYNTMGPCNFFRKESKNSTNVIFSKHHWENQNWTSKTSYGFFFRTQGRNERSAITNRTADNGVTVSSSPSGTPNTSYKLVFTDYENCSIIRPFPLHIIGLTPGLSYQEPQDLDRLGLLYKQPTELEKLGLTNTGTKKVCILLLADDAARKVKKVPDDLPKKCQYVYKNICGREPKLKIVFQESCPSIPNPLGC